MTFEVARSQPDAAAHSVAVPADAAAGDDRSSAPVVLTADLRRTEREARDAILHAPAAAVVQVERAMQEPSDLGGDYVVLRVVRFVHGTVPATLAGWGAHGQHLPRAKVGAYFVAALEPFGDRRAWRGDPRWSIDLPDIDARAYALIGVPSREDGLEMLAEIFR